MTRGAILFDLDETLYRERRFALTGFAAVARVVAACGGTDAPTAFRLMVRELRQGRRAHALQALCRSVGWPETSAGALVDVIRVHEPALRLPRETREMLDLLRPTWRLAIVTNGPAAIQQRKVNALGLARLVDRVVMASRFGSGCGKPEAAPFIAALSQLGTRPERAVFVGDDPVRDIAGARAVGMKTIRVRRRAHQPAIDKGIADADVVVSQLRDVPHAISHLLPESPVGRTLCA